MEEREEEKLEEEEREEEKLEEEEREKKRGSFSVSRTG